MANNELEVVVVGAGVSAKADRKAPRRRRTRETAANQEPLLSDPKATFLVSPDREGLRQEWTLFLERRIRAYHMRRTTTLEGIDEALSLRKARS